MKKTTDNLRQMQQTQEEMHWQFGEPQEFLDFVDALNDTQNGWVSSNC